MSSVALVNGFFDAASGPMTESPAWLEPLDPGWRWVAYVPLAKPQSQLEGVVYMYPAGVAADGYPSGMPSYSVAYSLRFSDGKLAEGSDLWMDSFGNGAFAPPIPRHLLPYREWLDYRPLPVITGENSKDPKLLGVDEYVQKGLIKPPPAQPEDEAAETPSAEQPAEQAPPASATSDKKPDESATPNDNASPDE